MADTENFISLREHLEILRAADMRAIEISAEWTRERLESHNGLIQKMERDRSNFASVEGLNSLRNAFEVYKEAVNAANAITAKALTLAEGKTSGSDATRNFLFALTGLLIGVLMAALAVLKLT